MTQPPLTPGTHVEIRPGAASAWGRRFPAGGQATVLAIAVPDDLVGQEVYVLPDGDPSHHTLLLRVEDLTPIELEPSLAEQGRRLASEREDLIAAGADPRELLIPLHPHDARPTVPAAPPAGVGTSEAATGAQADAGETGLGAALRAWTFAKHETDGPTEQEWWDAHEALADRADALERGGRELGRILDDTLADVLNLSGAHHLIDEDGDGDWGAVWDILGELVEKGKRAEKTEAQIERVRALADEYARGRGGPTAKRIRAALDGAQ
jgi:hypothetical protein